MPINLFVLTLCDCEQWSTAVQWARETITAFLGLDLMGLDFDESEDKVEKFKVN